MQQQSCTTRPSFHAPLFVSSFVLSAYRANVSTAPSAPPARAKYAVAGVVVLVEKQDPLCTPALRTLGNMVSGNEAWADAVMVHKEFLPCLDAVLKNQVRRLLTSSDSLGATGLLVYWLILDAPGRSSPAPWMELDATECA